MKKNKFLLAALLFALVSCGANSGTSVTPMPSINLDTYVNEGKNTGSLGSFNLIGPSDESVVSEVKEFSWGESTNAESYTIEICSHPDFISGLSTVDYYSKENIKATSFAVYSQFAFKNTTYYWRVTAKNTGSTKQCENVFTFFLQADEVEEYKFDLGEADDWKLHPTGSYADVFVENNNFFENNEKSVRISFKKEDTSQGIPTSDGWIVVTKTIEKNIYGTDALYFKCFYAGQESSIFIRLIDRDNEFWVCPIQISRNAKQTVVMKFEDFTQRKGDVVVANQEFDYERIKYLEVVFEKTFGDGVFLMSDVKAIKFSNYKDLFLEKVNFANYDSSRYTYENYNFEYVTKENELELNYYGNTDGGHQKINGYGFIKLNLGACLYGGDAIKVSVKYSGSAGSGANALLRIYEEDTDRWSYKIPFTSLTKDEYRTLVIPFRAFAKSAIQGDGKRQFYYIINLQFGLEKMYGTGTLSFKDFEVVKTKDYSSETVRVVGDDGLIEDFSSYEFNSDMFKIWTVSDSNKDEYMDLNTTSKVIGDNNRVCGTFEYKCDMEAAMYYLPVECKNNDYKSISMWLCDQSLKDSRDEAIHVTNWNPETIIYVRLVTGEIYAYADIKQLSPIWHEYNFPFEDFVLTNPNDIKGGMSPFTPEYISHVGIAFQYYYKKADGKTPMPMYTDDNPVLIDNICFTEETEYRQTLLQKLVTKDSSNFAYVDDFESYASDAEVLNSWAYSTTYGYEQRELSSDVSSLGGSKSLKMQFKGKEASPAYFIGPSVDSSISSKAFIIHLKSDVAPTVYINIYTMTDGKENKYRVTLTDVRTSWCKYAIGINKFLREDSQSLGMNDIKNVSRISIGMDYYGNGELHYVYVDNIYFDMNYTSYPSSLAPTVID